MKVATEEIRREELPTTVHDLTQGPDGTVYLACLDGTVRASPPEGGVRDLPEPHRSYASGVVCLRKAGIVISGGYDGCLHWYDARTEAFFRRVKAHDFWSWQLAASPDESLVASSTGQYVGGSYRYEPAAEREPSVKVFDTRTGELVRSFAHVPPVESVCFSGDGRFLAAGNLMGEIRVWEVASGRLASTCVTPDFTGWGIIKGHYYTGGIFSLAFSPGDERLYAAGMGTTRDPAAGNGKQLWQAFDWRGDGGRKVAENGDSGKGLMETLCFHPSGACFIMAGRLESGSWNAAVFEGENGSLLHSFDSKSRITRAEFSAGGDVLLLAGGRSQDGLKEGRFRPYGHLSFYACELGS